jgi:hypothetical protein
VGFLGHSWRKALASYGSKALGWTDDDAKLILDHLEGHEPNDVTAQFYNSNPAILRKRRMMTEWQTFLDRCEAEAIAADPVLKDPQRLGELCYIHYYGEKSHAYVGNVARRKGRPLPWSKVERLIRNGAVIETSPSGGRSVCRPEPDLCRIRHIDDVCGLYATSPAGHIWPICQFWAVRDPTPLE